MKREKRPGEQHRAKREQRQHIRHRLNGTLARVPVDAFAPLLARVIEIADARSVRAVLLGSVSRGEASRWSDIDLERWVALRSDLFETPPDLASRALETMPT